MKRIMETSLDLEIYIMKLPLELNNTTNRKFAKEMQGERAA
jgi:hypothetical protein